GLFKRFAGVGTAMHRTHGFENAIVGQLESAAAERRDFRRRIGALKYQRHFAGKTDGPARAIQRVGEPRKKSAVAARGAIAEFKQILRFEMAARNIGSTRAGMKQQFTLREQCRQFTASGMKRKTGIARGDTVIR